MLRGFACAFKAMFWGFVMIFMSLVLFAILTVDLMHAPTSRLNKDNEWCVKAFTSVQDAILFYFQTLVAGDSWGQCVIPLIRDDYKRFMVFAVVLVCVQLGFMNLILSVIVDAAAAVRDESAQEIARMREL